MYVTGSNTGGAIVYKYDVATGTSQWPPPAPGGSGVKVRVDNSGNIYVGGNSGGHFALWQYNSSGALQSTQTYSGNFNTNSDVMTTMTTDNSGNIFLAGRTYSGYYVGSENTWDWMVLKYSAGGTFFPSVAGFVNSGLASHTEQLLDYDMSQNYPNPFNPTTTIRFSVSQAGSISLKVYDALGREVKTLIDNQYFESGAHDIGFNASQLASGLYFYRMIANQGKFQKVQKMILRRLN